MDKQRRILILPSWYPPDGGYFFKEHSEAIQKMGWEVDVLVIRWVGIRKLMQAGASTLRRNRIKNENGLRIIRSVYLKIPGSEKQNIHCWAVQTNRMYKKYEKRFGKPDLILAHSVTWAGYAASIIKEKFGIPYLVAEHRSFFVWSTEKARNMVKSYYRPFFEKAYRNCSRVVLVSESLMTGLKALMPWIGEKTIIIPNMIREDMFLPPMVPRKTDPFVFVWAGRLEHVKGVDLLLEATRILNTRAEKTFTVRLVGKGTLRGELEKLAVSLKVNHLVQFLGRLTREEIQKEMQAANCFVLPTRYEAFGVVLIEAMATGLPVIATRSGGPEHIVTKDSGILIDTDHADQLADAMEQMMLKSQNYSAQTIRRQTLEQFGQNSVMEQYNHLFLSTLKK